jgi:hypothetical protein
MGSVCVDVCVCLLVKLWMMLHGVSVCGCVCVFTGQTVDDVAWGQCVGVLAHLSSPMR